MKIKISPFILTVFIISILYWIYLALITQMIMVYDAIGYEQFGRMIVDKGFGEYLATGPNREPMYPLLIAFSMKIADIFNIHYQHILRALHVIILLISQLLIYKLLKMLKIHNVLCALVLLYFAFSPAIINSAFSLFSEIATYPFVLALVLLSTKAWKALDTDRVNVYWASILLSLFFILAISIKAIFEPIAWAFLILFLLIAMVTFIKKDHKMCKKASIFFLIFFVSFHIPIFLYKHANKVYNGNFTLTNRGPMALYGNTARRIRPVTFENILTALTSIADEEYCAGAFDQDRCHKWTFREVDRLGHGKMGELFEQNMDKEETDRALINLSVKKAVDNPLSYGLFTSIEMIEMFFWDSTNVGFVAYPDWLSILYKNMVFKNSVRFTIPLITLCSFIFSLLFLWKNKSTLNNEEGITLFFIIVILLCYIGVHSMFFIVTRYILPVAPLYLLSIGFFLQKIIFKNQT